MQDASSDQSSESPVQCCCCPSCWHCYRKKDPANQRNAYETAEQLSMHKTQNMLLSIIYLLCIITTSTAFVLTFWVELVPVHWIHVLLIVYTAPGLFMLGYYLTNINQEYEYCVDSSHHVVYRTFIIALIPCSIAYITLNILRFVLYFEVDRNFTDIVFVNCIAFYVAFQILFILKYAKRGVKESLSMRLFLNHILGTNVFLWLHEFSVHSTHSLEFLQHRWSQKYLSQAPRTVRVIEIVEPYIYPLVIQLMLVACGAIHQIWLDVGSMDPSVYDIYIDDEYESHEAVMDDVFVFPTAYNSDAVASDSTLSSGGSSQERRCSWLSCGFVLGSCAFIGLVLIASLVMTEWLGNHVAIRLYTVYQICLYICMLIATYLALFNLREYTHFTREMGALEMLILLSMLGYILFAEFSIVAAFNSLSQNSGYVMVLSLLRLLHTGSQTMALLRSLHYHHAKGPSKRFIQCPYDSLLFLALCNGALWVVESMFDLRMPTSTPTQNDHYGSDLWRAIRFCLFPLCSMYRFLTCIAFLEVILFN